MDIVKENIDDLNAVIKVKIGPTDYLDRYNNALKKYQKKMDLPGFRPGKVPVDMVKKRYGKQIMFEEINGMLSDSLHRYIYENNIEILGNPLPKLENLVDFDKQTDFEFKYDIGLAPKINVELSSKDKYDYYSIKADDELIGKHIDYFRKNYGQVIHPEKSEDKDVLVGEFTEVDGDGNVVPAGIYKTAMVDVSKITNVKNIFLGLAIEDKIVLSSISDDAAYLAEILEMPAEKIKSVSLQFRLKNLSRIVQAEVNQELFDKIYGPGKVNSEEEFKAKINEELQVMFVGDSDRKFFNEVIESLMKKANLNLPEAFLKKFLLASNKEKISVDQIDKEYSNYSNALKWQLLENHLLKAHKIVVPTEEVQHFVTNAVKMNLAQRGMKDVPEDIVQEQVRKVMADEKQIRGAYERLYDQKLIELFKNTFTLNKKEISYDEFFKKTTPNS